ncbi:hypothetical protein FAP39_03295 [Shimia litoralis]|uniref:Uncharacterized protein n=1 Tax=Shimia litoralis TaxID=420403 RepID=A0A4U7N8E4_9RHOB|nr:hypothetical protein [Shimia litoralis]TKZ22239.1 hypothetical protein FAP39_03295 [Shimia litoralis]
MPDVLDLAQLNLTEYPNSVWLAHFADILIAAIVAHSAGAVTVRHVVHQTYGFGDVRGTT